MLIALYFFIMNVALPQIAVYAEALIEPVMIIVITLAGLVMILGAVGMKVSANLGSTIVNGIFRGIGYVFQAMFHAIGWIVKSSFRLLPRVFAGARKTFTQWGLNSVWSNVLAVLVTVIVLVIII